MKKNEQNTIAKTGTKIDFRSISNNGGAKFIMSAPHFRDLPRYSVQEYCIMGRSNVGKSSFMNHVLESGSLAKVSKKPGKTTCANVFEVNLSLVWVDLPGYGYARSSQGEKLRWSSLIREYCTKRENLCGILWLIDIRHIGISADREAYQWFRQLKIPVLPILTKCDKLSKQEQTRQCRDMERTFPALLPAVPYSILSHGSRERFWKQFLKLQNSNRVDPENQS